MVTTTILSSASSWAIKVDIAKIATLLVGYAAPRRTVSVMRPPPPVRPSGMSRIEPRLTISPPPFSRITGAHRFMIEYIALRLRSICPAHSSGVVSQKPRKTLSPVSAALFPRMSTRPKVASTSSTTRSRSSARLRSAPMASASQPSCSIASAVSPTVPVRSSSRRTTVRAVTATSAPSPASSSATARPIPRAAPVTSATFPCSGPGPMSSLLGAKVTLGTITIRRSPGRLDDDVLDVRARREDRGDLLRDLGVRQRRPRQLAFVPAGHVRGDDLHRLLGGRVRREVVGLAFGADRSDRQTGEQHLGVLRTPGLRHPLERGLARDVHAEPGPDRARRAHRREVDSSSGIWAPAVLTEVGDRGAGDLRGADHVGAEHLGPVGAV